MPDDFERRIKLIEDREAIMYRYIDELGAMSVRQEVRIRENEDTLRRVVAIQERMASAQERMDAWLQTVELQNHQHADLLGQLVESQGMLVKMFDRMDARLDEMPPRFDKLDRRFDQIEQKLDNLTNPGQSGQS